MGVVEVTRFRLADGVGDEAFLALDRRLQTELVPNRTGFLRRTTAHRDGDWVVVTLWSTEDDASLFERDTASDPLWTSSVASSRQGACSAPASTRSTRSTGRQRQRWSSTT